MLTPFVSPYHTLALIFAALGGSAKLFPGVAPVVPLKDYISTCEGIRAVAFSPDGRYLAVGGYGELRKSGALTLWDTQSQKRVAVFAGHTGPVLTCAFSPDGKTLASGSRDRTIRLWDNRTGKELAVLKDAMESISSVAFSPDGTVVAGAVWPLRELPRGSELDYTTPGVVLLWDTKTFKVRAKLEGHVGPVGAIAFSPDGTTLAAASGKWDKKKDRAISGEVRLWDVARAKSTGVITGHTDRIEALAYRPDGKALATGSARWTDADGDDLAGEIKLWDTTSNKTIATSTVHKGTGISSLSFSMDGKVLASGSGVLTVPSDLGFGSAGELVLLRTNDLKELGKITDLSTAVSTVFNPRSHTLAASDNGRVRMWKVTDK
ncbi:WD40 repeat domain-containing protein [Gemmata sp. JC673]|uniref:WD40 repeat domain-containing protein n=1 Tax=Gemmata algarum TaxID=2975278 RepID=A0ABU5F827_9BACT|nr:WD40 repeat domain-containing protein [Gemmata algarum]MDY3562016.1 WD40 repeat domain-containing protein [Gemmata algarum]